MATDYTSIVDALKGYLEAERTTSLSSDLSAAVVSVKKGQYVPDTTSAKPAVYVRAEVPSAIQEMAGHMRRMDQLTLLISGAVANTDMETACDDASNLMNNIQNILMHHGSDALWSGGHFGEKPGDEENPERMGVFQYDPSPDNVTVHFMLRFSVLTVIDREAI